MFRYAKLNIKCKRFYLKVKKKSNSRDVNSVETGLSGILQYKQKYIFF